ncbi:MAG: putative formate dehydrogenase, partial [Symbiobacteriaceae bacterium]|nr:putative formate dehydrogenase [Symbiobacteriaceae bacterium]
RTFAIAHIGSAALDNEENYLLQKLHRAAGVVRIEHHARL